MIAGNDGDDTLTGLARRRPLNGGAGANTFNDGPGDDTSRAGRTATRSTSDVGRDVLRRATGTTSSPTAAAGGVTITLAGGADDGEAGEGDNVGADAEQAEGGGGTTCSSANDLGNTLTGGRRQRHAQGGTGSDRLVGNEGDDMIDARDGRDDSIDCGPGHRRRLRRPRRFTENCEVAPDVDGEAT